jgi:hypothetical protein
MRGHGARLVPVPFSPDLGWPRSKALALADSDVVRLTSRSESNYDRPIDADSPKIGTLNEGSLHAALKARYAQPGDEFEVPLGGFVIDIRRPDLLVEIQTSSFRSMGRKFDDLLSEHRILLVHPIAVETYLQRDDEKPRKSPKRGSIFAIFEELVSIPTLLDHPNLMLDVVLVSLTKVQRTDPTVGFRRRGLRTIDRQLREVLEVRRFETTEDLVELLPKQLPDEFTTADIAAGAKVPRDVAQRMAFCFRALEVIHQVGRSKAGIHYSLA